MNAKPPQATRKSPSKPRRARRKPRTRSEGVAAPITTNGQTRQTDTAGREATADDDSIRSLIVTEPPPGPNGKKRTRPAKPNSRSKPKRTGDSGLAVSSASNPSPECGTVAVSPLPNGGPPAQVASLDPIGQFRSLSSRAQAGDQTAVRSLRDLLANQPLLVEIFGDTGRLARQSWVTLTAGRDPGAQHAMMARTEWIIDQAAGPHATPIERLLAEQIGTAWIRLSNLTINETVEAGLWDKPSGDYLLKRHDQALRQFHESIRQLEEYRRMLARVAHVQTG